MLRLYYTDVRALTPYYDRALALLPPARRERAEQCRFPAARLRSAAAGLLLRHVLDVTEDGRLQYGENGRPFLPDGPEFSLTHGGDLAALAVCDAPVGVDAEPRGRSMQQYYMSGVLTPRELAWYHASPEYRFAHLWTRKEAVMKATGLGLRLSPKRIEVLDDEISCAGLSLHLQTMELAGHMLSLAAAAPAAPELICLPPETICPVNAAQGR